MAAAAPCLPPFLGLGVFGTSSLPAAVPGTAFPFEAPGASSAGARHIVVAGEVLPWLVLPLLSCFGAQ